MAHRVKNFAFLLSPVVISPLEPMDDSSVSHIESKSHLCTINKNLPSYLLMYLKMKKELQKFAPEYLQQEQQVVNPFSTTANFT